MPGMGYEVLDSASGAAAPPALRPERPQGPAAVLELADEPPPQSPPRRRYVLAVISGIAGITIGALWANYHNGQVREQDRRSTVTAVAAVDSVNSYPMGQNRVADFAISVVNAGPLPLELVMSPDGAQPTRSTPVLRMLSGDSKVPSGGEMRVLARLGIDCSSTDVVRLQLPVRTVNGSVRQLPVLSSPQQSARVTGRTLCVTGQQEELVSSRLIGTVDLPVLRLQNNTDLPVLVSLNSGSPLTQSSSAYLSLTTRPSLPVTVPAQQVRELALRIDVQGCRRDLSALEGIGYLSLNTEPVGGGSVPTTGFPSHGGGVDVSPLIGAAVQRSCG